MASDTIELSINGHSHQVNVEPEMPLLWVLRNELGLTGSKYGCGIGMCGACTVQVDGRAVRSCVMPVSAAQGAQVTTIEGLAESAGAHSIVQQAWIKHQVPQCGYCQPGMIMAVSALLQGADTPDPETVQRDLTNICRCGTYPRISRAIGDLLASSLPDRDQGDTA